MSRSYTYAIEYSSQIECIKVHGLFEREKFVDDFRSHRKFWCRGYYVDTVGRNKKVIEEYIKNQLQDDIAND